MAMASSSSNTPTHTKDQEYKSISRPLFKPRNHRTPSFSSSSSRSNSWDSSSFSFTEEEFSTNYSPIITPTRFKGIPFSWEENPGIPKKNRKNSIADDQHLLLLPLPPVKSHGSSNNQELMTNPLRKHNSIGKLRKDPFFAALLECSKDRDDHGATTGNNKMLKGGFKNGVTRSLRFGFVNMYASCKSAACDVSDSSVYVPITPRPHYLLNRH